MVCYEGKIPELVSPQDSMSNREVYRTASFTDAHGRRRTDVAYSPEC
jgi:hypothetical protein